MIVVILKRSLDYGYLGSGSVPIRCFGSAVCIYCLSFIDVQVLTDG
jgi:hypothetical protein